MRARRRSFVEARGSHEISLHFSLISLLNTLIIKDYVISAYWPTKFECDVIASLVAHDFCANRMCLPCADSVEETLVFRRWKLGDALAESALGFLQPSPQADIVEPSVILTPLVAFDDDGHRLGQGAGHYDRAFAARPDALRIGIAWSVQRTGRVPNDPWDMPLDAVMTEKDLMIMPQSRISL